MAQAGPTAAEGSPAEARAAAGWAAAGPWIARSLRASGLRRGDMVHVSYGYGLFTGGLGAHYGVERMGGTVVPFGGGQTERQVQLITEFQPRGIMVTPSYVLNILEAFQAQGIDPRGTSLDVGVFGAEPWTNAMRVEIEEAFDMHAVDIYGLSEIIGPGVANECVETKDAGDRVGQKGTKVLFQTDANEVGICFVDRPNR